MASFSLRRDYQSSRRNEDYTRQRGHRDGDLPSRRRSQSPVFRSAQFPAQALPGSFNHSRLPTRTPTVQHERLTPFQGNGAANSDLARRRSASPRPPPVRPRTPPSMHSGAQDIDAEEDPFTGSLTPASTIPTHVQEQYVVMMEDLELARDTKRWSTPSSKRPAGKLQHLARMCMRFHGAYISVSQAVSIGFIISTSQDLEDAKRRHEALRECPAATRDRYVELFNWLVDMAPFLRPMLPLFEEHPLDVTLLGDFVDFHARQGRSSDINSLKKYVLTWLVTTTGQALDGNREHWGFYNERTARLLAPRRMLHDFNRDPDGFRDRVISGDLTFGHESLPNLLYDDADPSLVDGAPSLTEGLLESKLLMSSLRCVFEGASAVTKAPGLQGSGRPSISRKHAITSVKAQSIGYIACLVHFILGTVPKWDDQDPDVFDGEAFFYTIVQYLEVQTFADEVLPKYTRYVYGERANTGRKNVARHAGPNDAAMVLAQLTANASGGAAGGNAASGGQQEAPPTESS